jgi:hypothetical protein
MSARDNGPRGVDPHHEDTLRAVREALEQIVYGSIVITIHQGEVVGIETSTKMRLKSRRGEAPS